MIAINWWQLIFDMPCMGGEVRLPEGGTGWGRVADEGGARRRQGVGGGGCVGGGAGCVPSAAPSGPRMSHVAASAL